MQVQGFEDLIQSRSAHLLTVEIFLRPRICRIRSVCRMTASLEANRLYREVCPALRGLR